ncbi:MAG: alpha/beta hydrolase, partial [Bacteroidota bacterium]
MRGQVTIIVDSVPSYTPAGAQVFIAGTFNQWNPGASAHQLSLIPDSTRRITLPAGSGPVSFKFTRGSWASVEGNALGAFRPNRTFTYGNGDTIRLKILSWEDLHSSSGGGGGTANAQVSLLTDTFWMPTLNRYRRIWLYLPVDYATSPSQRYPVIYMHDGQNLFNAATSFAGEWEVDECLTRLHGQGDQGAIVVGIENGGSQRINEYSPWVHPQYGGGQGDAYLQFIVQTLKPYIDARYRTDSTRNGTWIWGSSMGGLISQYGAVKYQEVFSRVGVFSPSLWFDQRIMQQPLQEGYRMPVRFYLMAGALEGSSMLPQLNQLKDQLLLAGFPASQVQTVARSDGQHAEWFWRREFQEAYQWLKGSMPSSAHHPISPSTNPKLMVLPQPCGSACVLRVLFNNEWGATGQTGSETAWGPIPLQIVDPTGRVVHQGMLESSETLLDNVLPAGIYRLQAVWNGQVVS